jgi:hypothetical protein
VRKTRSQRAVKHDIARLRKPLDTSPTFRWWANPSAYDVVGYDDGSGIYGDTSVPNKPKSAKTSDWKFKSFKLPKQKTPAAKKKQAALLKEFLGGGDIDKFLKNPKKPAIKNIKGTGGMKMVTYKIKPGVGGGLTLSEAQQIAADIAKKNKPKKKVHFASKVQVF